MLWWFFWWPLWPLAALCAVHHVHGRSYCTVTTKGILIWQISHRHNAHTNPRGWHPNYNVDNEIWAQCTSKTRGLKTQSQQWQFDRLQHGVWWCMCHCVCQRICTRETNRVKRYICECDDMAADTIEHASEDRPCPVFGLLCFQITVWCWQGVFQELPSDNKKYKK